MRQYLVNTFTDTLFKGNPVAVCILDEWLNEELMRLIACENNVVETVFAVKEKDSYYLRWYTPEGELDLCGDAALAAAFVIVDNFDLDATELTFHTSSGEVRVTRDGDLYTVELPVYPMKPVELTTDMVFAMGVIPEEAYQGQDLVLVLKDEEAVRNCTPDYKHIRKLGGLLVHITARGTETDCVVRSFSSGLFGLEDPICCVGHCHVIPYWAEKLGKKELLSYQASPRGGYLQCRYEGDKVYLSGHVKLFSIAVLDVNR
ncbi:MAG: PhzF family phenazine biosynthesis protein [Mogibacterium sp.]|nr:PhzF family phenazine biosynthesis protein [Mogibacterium sp.]